VRGVRMRRMNAQADGELQQLKRKLWRIGVIAGTLEQKLSDRILMQDRKLREEVIRDGLRELFAEVALPPGRRKKNQRA
jgi:hypothetical protein